MRIQFFRNHPKGHPDRLGRAYRKMTARRTVHLIWLGPVIILVRFH